MNSNRKPPGAPGGTGGQFDYGPTAGASPSGAQLEADSPDIAYDNAHDTLAAMTFFSAGEAYESNPGWEFSDDAHRLAHTWNTTCLNVPHAQRVIDESFHGDISDFSQAALGSASNSGVGFEDHDINDRDKDILNYYYSDYPLEGLILFNEELNDGVEPEDIEEPTLDAHGVSPENLGHSPASRAFYRVNYGAGRDNMRAYGDMVDKQVLDFARQSNTDGIDARSIEKHANQLNAIADHIRSQSSTDLGPMVNSGASEDECRMFFDQARRAADKVDRESEWWRTHASTHGYL